MELHIVAIAVVSIKNQDNWFFFLEFLLAHLIRPPAFIVSDRNQGLIPAVKAIQSIPHHLYCFRHMAENFNKKFKSKQLKAMAWNVARALTEDVFNKELSRLRNVNASAGKWLM
uniref:Uncharacterized protein AlNc14C231G9290 n=1 Tax=Albugo laibachii Nc14 TaxID=890382 RepID=F0WSF0_9STRA|nr:hypothetical protein SORBIDRAFT_07g022850 [Albugo laibachii Nc14]CCA27953.1 hypothetical protein SORBIDRAFT_07g022850 [Albugo laibachii Nc14]|eukprot:CCA27953.1 hypothetical protein SORBIDRAFT_07g022850 [Albugo laibachii Nc14]